MSGKVTRNGNGDVIINRFNLTWSNAMSAEKIALAGSAHSFGSLVGGSSTTDRGGSGEGAIKRTDGPGVPPRERDDTVSAY
jgi:hypothetical protein